MNMIWIKIILALLLSILVCITIVFIFRDIFLTNKVRIIKRTFKTKSYYTIQTKSYFFWFNYKQLGRPYVFNDEDTATDFAKNYILNDQIVSSTIKTINKKERFYGLSKITKFK